MVLHFLLAVFHVTLIFFSPASTDLCHVNCCLPLSCFPCGVHLSATHATFLAWPYSSSLVGSTLMPLLPHFWPAPLGLPLCTPLHCHILVNAPLAFSLWNPPYCYSCNILDVSLRIASFVGSTLSNATLGELLFDDLST